jgi:hypothetical protein
MKHLDALATLGDPWPNLGAVQHDIAFRGPNTATMSALDLLDFVQRMGGICATARMLEL